MKIVTIFDDKLFAFHYDDEENNELDRLLELWLDTYEVSEFIKKNKKDIPKIPQTELVKQIINDAEEIEDLIEKLSTSKKRNFDEFFKALNDLEVNELQLSKRKGKKNYLRLYALKIASNCYIITGGAIKFTHRMADSPHTAKELDKIEKCRTYLKDNGVFDDDSFYEFLNEEQ